MLVQQQQVDLMQAFIKVVPHLNELINDDVAVAVYDTEKMSHTFQRRRFI